MYVGHIVNRRVKKFQLESEKCTPSLSPYSFSKSLNVHKVSLPQNNTFQKINSVSEFSP